MTSPSGKKMDENLYGDFFSTRRFFGILGDGFLER